MPGSVRADGAATAAETNRIGMDAGQVPVLTCGHTPTVTVTSGLRCGGCRQGASLSRATLQNDLGNGLVDRRGLGRPPGQQSTHKAVTDMSRRHGRVVRTRATRRGSRSYDMKAHARPPANWPAANL